MISLRPNNLDDIILDEKLRTVINTIIDSASIRNTVVGHILLGGPSGTGKSTIAHAISNKIGGEIEFSNGANLRTLKNVAPFVMRIKKGGIFFIDEIHRMTKIVQEFLYTVIEDGFCVLGKEQLKIKIPPFTMIGATTDIGLLTKPFRDRFKHHLLLSLYNNEQMKKIAQANIRKLGVNFDEESLDFTVNISRGTPRVLNKYLEWARDYMLTHNVKMLCKKHIKYAMELIEVDQHGFTKNDRRYLNFLVKNGTAGIDTIAASLGIDKKTVEETIEPYLLSKGYIIKTSKGRELGYAIQNLSTMQQ
jgi:Holliday junction DNA helicase RuvB